MTTSRAGIAIVGAGPRGTGILERLGASLPELYPDGELDVHMIDPFPAGGGRIWRHEQSPLLAMNSMAADVTMFTDATVVCAGPIRPGPTFARWAELLRDGELPGEDIGDLGPVLAAELRAVTPTTFPSRRLQSEYLGWVFRRVVAGLPDRVHVHVHRGRATALAEDGEDQLVSVEGLAEPLRVDTVVLASGHLDARPTDDEAGLVRRAGEHGLRYLPPEQTTDSDLSVIEPGEPVIVRGMGLAFVDLVVLLFEGRGGRFEDRGDGELRYVPSGAEPRLFAGSPRGAPYHSKTHYQLQAGRPSLPRFFSPDVLDRLAGTGRPLELRAELWPLMAKEIGWGWYHELVMGHPERVRLGWGEFAERYAAADWDSPEMARLLTEAVPDPIDRIDFATLDRPLDGLRADTLAGLQPLVRARIAEDLRQHVDPAYTPHLGAFVAMLSVYGEITRLQGEGALSDRSRAHDVGWWQSFFNAVTSGPPGFRVRELLALSRAGYVDFLGPGMWLDVDDTAGVFRAGSAALAGAPPVTARVVVDARLPGPSAGRTVDPLLAGLLRDGAAAEDILLDDDGSVLLNTGLIRVRPADGALLDADGVAHPRRFAVGPHTVVKVAGAFTRPGTNAQSLRYNDAVARAVLSSVAEALPERIDRAA
ncbi:FAD/NAD(P)-binding protein [Pseudonocardia acidicola]|uniref:FAD/NAD(P)-binding protein n=1 Tax=Pseudonocardia acidicola TaxID=2724939 RepID=A0ABX1S571_9PSEU|nr:FAD/NAD(P)-binding protein [Pseudonocardia acidicola]NMH96695.1 FAD/NAD(P)-binding protein [Pseudonocardia acidicola]